MSDKKLRETFSQKGQVTDVQLKYDKDGNFRHFGFIGFKTEDEAESAMHYFNNTFVGSCKIQVLFSESFSRLLLKFYLHQVERCVNLGESAQLKRGKKIPPPPSLPPKKEKPKDDQNKTQKPEDPEFAEFVEIHSRSNKDKIWDNDDIDGYSKPLKPNKSKTEEENQLDLEDKLAHKKEISDLEVFLFLKVKIHHQQKPTSFEYFLVPQIKSCCWTRRGLGWNQASFKKRKNSESVFSSESQRLLL